MRVRHLLGVALFGATAATACEADADCNGAGRCDAASNTCSCVRGYTGDACEKLNFGKSGKCGEGGLCLDGTSAGAAGVIATWGAGVVRDDASPPRYHMYAAGMSNRCTLDTWLTNSVVVHAVADAVEGPYKAADIAFGPTGAASDASWDAFDKHNPAPVRTADGKYVVYYMGTKAVNGTHLECVGGAAEPASEDAAALCGSVDDQRNLPVCNQRVGVAVADSPYGPWTLSAAPVMDVGPPGAWDDLFTTNPTVHVFANNSAIMVYKARSKENSGAMRTGIAYAKHYLGPFRRAADAAPLDIPSTCEDAGVHYDAAMGVYRMILHCAVNYLPLWSTDGYSWKALAQQPYGHVEYRDGSAETFGRRERPQWVQNEWGELTHLITAVQPATGGSHAGQTWTLVTDLV